MIVNPDKHQAMMLGADSDDYELSVPVNNSIDILFVTIGKALSFNRHILKNMR